jgi:hypothetical protein
MLPIIMSLRDYPFHFRHRSAVLARENGTHYFASFSAGRT